MRKNAGFIIFTLLLLTVPALANAWTLAVKVAGGTDINNVSVAYGTVSNTFKSTSSYLYPVGAATITNNATASATASLTFDGVTIASGFVTPTSGNHTLAVSYATTQSNSGLTLAQASGGTIYALNRNNTWTTTAVSGLVAGSAVTVDIAADANHKITGFTVGAATGVLPATATGLAGEVLALSIPADLASSTVTPVFALAGKMSASLFTPTAGTTNNPVNCTITPTSNDALANLTYSFSVTGLATFASTDNTKTSFSFTPTVAGTYKVAATVTDLLNGGSFTTPAATIVVALAQTNANQGCNSCHSTQPALHTYADVVVDCTSCHSATPHNTKLSCTGCHSVVQTNPFSDKTLVNDNAGVRAVTGEFSKWSHHVVNANGLAVQDEQCAVCHLEGTVGGEGLMVDSTKHMIDNKTHLRNVQDDTQEFVWDPATPNHANMDNFCMTCHSAAGATSAMSMKLQALITPLTGITASPLNPFGDTISNRYDKMKRPAVTNVDNQFDTGNNSHHGVKGARYTGRTRVAGARQIASPSTFANNSSLTLQGVRSTIYDAGNFNALYVPLGTNPATVATTGLGDDSTLHCGDCHTVGQWKAGSTVNAAGAANTVVIGAHGSNNEYMLRNSLGTDERHAQIISVNTKDASGRMTVATISITNPNTATLVCFNCHATNNYGVFVQTGLNGGNAAGNQVAGQYQSHAGEYAEAGRCNGAGNTLPFNGYTTGKATDGTQFESRFKGPVTAADAAAGYVSPEFGNVYGIQCLNCHNSGAANSFGGIHGSAKNTDAGSLKVATIAYAAGVTINGGAYINGMGNVSKVERFLPGLGNVMHVPGTLGGFTGGTSAVTTPAGVYNGKGTITYQTGGVSSDTNWEQKYWLQTASQTVINYKTGVVTQPATAVGAGAGCYTLGADQKAVTATAGVEGSLVGPSNNGNGPSDAGTWGGCEDHGAQQGAANHGFMKRIVRPVTY